MGILDGIVEWIAEQVMYGLDLINTSVLGALGCNMSTFLRYFPAAETMYHMLMLSVYASYGMRESLNFNRVDLQTLSLFFIGTIASMIGMVLGHALFADEKSKEKSK